MWKTYAKVQGDPAQRRAALSSLLAEDNFNVPEREEVSKQLAEDIMGDIQDVELRRLVVRAVHRLSRDATPDSPIVTAPMMKRMADVSVMKPYAEEPEVAEYALRAMNNIVVHNKELANEMDESTMRALVRFLDQSEVFDALKESKDSLHSVSCAVRLANVSFSRPFYVPTISPVERRKNLRIMIKAIGRLLPPEDTPQDSWNVSNELSIALGAAMSAMDPEEPGPEELYLLAYRTLMAAKVMDDFLGDVAIQYAASLMCVCRPPDRGRYVRITELAKKVCSIAARSLERFVDPDTGSQNDVKLNYDMTVESALSPLWLLIANLSEHSNVLREIMEEYFFERAETDKPDRPPTKPKLPHLAKMLTSDQYPLLAFTIGNAMFLMGDKNARVMLNRFGIDASAGVLYTIGEQMKIEREMQERRNPAEIDDEDEEQFITKMHAVDDDMTAEQFYEMMSVLGKDGIIRPENPVQRAHEEGYLEKIEEELRQLDLEEQKREDEELQRVVDEWSKSKMRRTVGSANLPETEELEARALPEAETSAQGQVQQAQAKSVEKS